MSKMGVTIEPQSYKQYSVMQFVEFLEFIGRIADAKFKHSEMSQNTLTVKIEHILEDLCPAFGLTKKDVNIGVEDNSESDCDY